MNAKFKYYILQSKKKKTARSRTVLFSALLHTDWPKHYRFLSYDRNHTQSFHCVNLVLHVFMGLLPDTKYYGLHMHRERFPCNRIQRKLLASDPSIHHGRCVTHVPWCMSGSLTRDGIPGACATRNFLCLAWSKNGHVLCGQSIPCISGK